MRLTRICDYPYHTNIRKFTALLCWSWYFKFWIPAVFNRATVISWKVNAKFLQSRAMHSTACLTCALCVWRNNRLSVEEHLSHLRRCFCLHTTYVLRNAVVNTLCPKAVAYFSLRLDGRTQRKWFADTETSFLCSVRPISQLSCCLIGFIYKFAAWGWTCGVDFSTELFNRGSAKHVVGFREF